MLPRIQIGSLPLLSKQNIQRREFIFIGPVLVAITSTAWKCSHITDVRILSRRSQRVRVFLSFTNGESQTCELSPADIELLSRTGQAPADAGHEGLPEGAASARKRIKIIPYIVFMVALTFLNASFEVREPATITVLFVLYMLWAGLTARLFYHALRVLRAMVKTGISVETRFPSQS
jgi:hypothetical protein